MTDRREPGLPSAWVERFLAPAEWIADADKPAPASLDIACGSGRHLRLALRRGYRATGLDRDLSGTRDLSGNPNVERIEADLETGAAWPLGRRNFEVVIVTNYLHRPLITHAIAAVASDGTLIYETFAVGNERFGKPSNPDFLLRPGELLEAVAGRLTPIAYEHCRLREPDRIVQRIVAVGPRHRWLLEPPLDAPYVRPVP